MRARDQEIDAAVKAERARCLWCLDSIMDEIREGLQQKLLVESQRHLIQTKVKIAQAIIQKARRAIFVGAKPASKAICMPSAHLKRQEWLTAGKVPNPEGYQLCPQCRQWIHPKTGLPKEASDGRSNDQDAGEGGSGEAGSVP